MSRSRCKAKRRSAFLALAAIDAKALLRGGQYTVFFELVRQRQDFVLAGRVTKTLETSPPGPQRRAVIVRVQDDYLRDQVLDICVLCGVEPATADLSAGSLVICDAARRPTARAMRGSSLVQVASSGCNAGADLVLPEDGQVLAAVLTQWGDWDGATTFAVATAAGRANRAILVGSWHGGAGTSTAASDLARACTRCAPDTAVLVEASGNASFPASRCGAGVRWEDLDRDDLPGGASLVGSLGLFDSATPALLGRRAAPRADDRLVADVVRQVPGTCVVDCGSNVDALATLASRLNQGEVCATRVDVVLLGRARGQHVEAAARALAVLDESGLFAAATRSRILSAGGQSSLFRAAMGALVGTVPRAPRTAIGWGRFVRTWE